MHFMQRTHENQGGTFCFTVYLPLLLADVQLIRKALWVFIPEEKAYREFWSSGVRSRQEIRNFFRLTMSRVTGVKADGA
jgi:hypothetical protein